MKPIRPWVRLERRTIYARPPWLTLYADRIRLPDGRVLEDYHWLEMPHYVVVVAETTAGGFLVFDQYRYGVQGASLCLPGGGIDPGEAPEAAARRELLEETGHVAGQWRYLQPIVSNANAGGAIGHVFHAREAAAVQAPASGDLEDMNLLVLDRPQLEAALFGGRFVVANNLAAIALVIANACKSP